jgi:hypothetical protein
VSTVDPQRPVTRADIEAKLAQIKDATSPHVEAAGDTGRSAMIGGAVVVVVLAFLLGRRAGRKKNTVVEIRRI